MKKRSLSSFIAGAVVALLLVAVVIPVGAAVVGKDITVFPDVSIFIDDKELNPTDANGNPVEVFIYEGTTYIPLRAVSTSLGKLVQWDNKTRTVYIGSHSSEKPAKYLENLDYFTSTGSPYWNFDEKDNLGETHSHCLKVTERGTSSLTYILNGQYTALTGTFFQEYDNRSDTNETVLNIYCDDEKVWSGTVAGGVMPIPVNVDLEGVLQLKIETVYSMDSYGYKGSYGVFGDVAFYS